LGNEDEQTVRQENGIAIPELARVIHFHRDARQRLDHVLADKGGVPTRPESQNGDLLKALPLLVGESNLIETDTVGILRQPAENRVADCGRLFIDFLQHEVAITALLRLSRAPADLLELRFSRVA